jgi:hypothetical protein
MAPYKWDYTNTLKADLPNYAYSHNSGESWTIGKGGPFLIRVDSRAAAAAFAAPELSTWAMLALGFAALGFASHRRARVATSVN